MNIYLSGAGGTGKSSVSVPLANRLNMEVSDGISRRSIYPIHTLEHQQYMCKEVFDVCVNQDNKVCCRTPLDVKSYSLAFGIDNAKMDDEHLEKFISTNPLIIFFPLYWLPQEDGFRPTDLALNNIVQNSMMNIIIQNDLKYYQVLDEPIVDRVDSITKFLEEYYG